MIHATILIKNFRSIFFSVNLDVDVTYLLDQYEFRMYVEVMIFFNVSSIWCIPAGKLHTFSCNLSYDRSEIFCSFGYF